MPSQIPNYRRLRRTPSVRIQQEAVRILRKNRHKPYGTQVPFVIDGVRYLGVIEEHIGGRVAGPHPGVSVFVEVEAKRRVEPSGTGRAKLSGTEFAASLPEFAGVARERAIVSAVRQGLHLPPVWVEVRTEWRGRRGRFFVMADAVRIGTDADSIRPNVTAAGSQRVADVLGALLPTEHLVRVAHAESVALGVEFSPCTQSRRGKAMASTEAMVEHSRAVDQQIGGRQGLVGPDVGKHWVLDNRTIGKTQRTGQPAAANFGWFREDGTPIQTLGTAHDIAHVDYSQICWLVRQDCIVDNGVATVVDVGSNPEFCGLVTGSDAPLRVFRIPGVPLPSDELDPTDTSKWPVLRRGMKNEFVRAWQRVLEADGHDLSPYDADADFGRITHNATVAWQKARGLAPTGVVDGSTREKIGSTPVAVPEPATPEFGVAGATQKIPFIQARHFKPVSGSQPRPLELVVLHSMEAAETASTAENVAKWFASPNSSVASAHYNIDDDSIVQSVREEDVAYGAPGSNHHGIHLEHAGYARQSRAQWLDAYSTRMLRRSAALTAWICRRRQIPVRAVDRAGLLRGERGITTHHAVALAFRKSTHTDPGPNFPTDQYLEWVRQAFGNEPRVGVWWDLPLPSSAAAARDQSQQLEELGIREVAVMLSDVSSSSPTPTMKVTDVGRLTDALHARSIGVVVTTWPRPTRDYIAALAEAIDPYLEATGAEGLEVDVEGQWASKHVGGYENLAQAGAALFEVMCALKSTYGLRLEATTFPYHSELSPKATIAHRVDRVWPQAYSRMNKKESGYGWNGALGPGNMQRLAWKRAAPLQAPETALGLAAWAQSGFPGHTAADAMQRAYDAAKSLGAHNVRYWSAKWILGQQRTKYSADFLRSLPKS